MRLGSLGDIVHAVPAAAALRRRFPGAQIDWLVDTRHRGILSLIEGIDRRIEHERTGGVGKTLDTIRELRRVAYDAAIDFQGLFKSAVLARLSGAQRVIGLTAPHLRERQAGIFYTERVDPGDAVHVVRKNLALVSRAFGFDAGEPTFPIDGSSSSAAARVREMLDLPQAGAFAVINPGGAWPNKQWPVDRFAAIARFLAERNLPSIVLWGPGEEALAKAVVSSAASSSVQVSPRTSIVDLVAITRAARLMVSGDTGPLHIAAAMGTPIVGIYGPTNPDRNGPWRADDLTASRFSRCACHHRRECRISDWCLADISIDEVRTLVARLLADRPSHA